eukprot:3312-Heterococcus_DN1.PRE.7
MHSLNRPPEVASAVATASKWCRSSTTQIIDMQWQQGDSFSVKHEIKATQNFTSSRSSSRQPGSRAAQKSCSRPLLSACCLPLALRQHLTAATCINNIEGECNDHSGCVRSARSVSVLSRLLRYPATNWLWYTSCIASFCGHCGATLRCSRRYYADEVKPLYGVYVRAGAAIEPAYLRCSKSNNKAVVESRRLSHTPQFERALLDLCCSMRTVAAVAHERFDSCMTIHRSAATEELIDMQCTVWVTHMQC